jgi:hypothetical protein
MDRLITIRKQKLKKIVNLTMFQEPILCHKLPKLFDSIKAHNNEEELANKRHKIIQDFKRRMLNIELGQYEIGIQQYEYLYEQELTAFESETCKINSPYQMCRLNMLMYFVETFLYHYTKRLIRRIRYKESCLHVKLVRHHHRHQKLATSKIIDVYPQIIVDVFKSFIESYLIRISFTYW